MSELRESVGQLDAKGRRFGVVAARFNERVVDRLVSSAVDCLVRHGASPSEIHLVRVPGAWEIPQALNALIAASPSDRGFDALIALGAVIRGETPHFDYVCSACAQGVARSSAQHGVPIAFGVLTCDDSRQADERSGGKAGNKGWEAALAGIEMASLAEVLRGSGPSR